MLFLRKTDETIWNPPFLRLPRPLLTNPPISEQIFHDPLFVQISKTRYPLPPLLLGREETMKTKEELSTVYVVFFVNCIFPIFCYSIIDTIFQARFFVVIPVAIIEITKSTARKGLF